MSQKTHVLLELRETRSDPHEQILLVDIDTNANDPDRIIAFASHSDLRRLSYCTTWLADGTFDVTLKISKN